MSETQPTLRYVQCPGAAAKDGPAVGAEFHRLAYWEWNATGNPSTPHVIVCLHGLSRQGRDFDTLARALSHHARVLCPDMPGRGESDWLRDPQQYVVPTYAGDMLAVIQQAHADAPITMLDWVGTSMGGLIGLAVSGQAAMPLPSPIRRLVLNDVGPVIEWDALQRIGSYLGKDPRFPSVEAAEQALWEISRGFGHHSQAEWNALSLPMLRRAGDGYRLHYDPSIAVPFQALRRDAASASEALLWSLYDHVTAPTLVLRGAQSDLLSADTAEMMTQRGPRAELIEFAQVGHAPTLVAQEQVDAVARFLLEDSPVLVRAAPA
jgi:pimeloyl-ACP methyl ester carboxylesterase